MYSVYERYSLTLECTFLYLVSTWICIRLLHTAHICTYCFQLPPGFLRHLKPLEAMENVQDDVRLWQDMYARSAVEVVPQTFIPRELPQALTPRSDKVWIWMLFCRVIFPKHLLVIVIASVYIQKDVASMCPATSFHILSFRGMIWYDKSWQVLLWHLKVWTLRCQAQ